MEAKLKTDRKALGARILHEIDENKKRDSSEKKSIWDEFKGFSKDLGDDFMDFPDFEHFYMKLEKGECDLDYDGRLRYNRHLCDLPVDIIQMIVAKLKIEEKWIFRESSSSLHKIIDPYFRGCKKLYIAISKGNGSVTYECGTFKFLCQIDYSEEKSEESGELEVHRSVKGNKLENGGKTVEESVIRDVRQMVENPEIRLDYVYIRSTLPEDNSFFDQLKPLLKSQENIQEVYIEADSPAIFHSILSGLKPKTLEEIELKSYEENMDLSEILEMDQLKEAKRVTLGCKKASYPLKDVLHFEEFDGQRDGWSSPDVLKIKNELTRTGKMKRFRVRLLKKNLPRLQDLLGRLNPEFHDSERKRHFRIQNSEEFMRMEISYWNITFTRVTEAFEDDDSD